ncbi:ABC transporter permease [uncultured Friedmanniella sp.]|uniref:ABC transporter permease n=1 Tax=uncultured Friedmanniella sp. TaxID=335381 RepID=UPI0035CBCBAE
MGAYIARRVANYIVLLFIAVSLSYFLAATQLHPRMLYQLINPPLDPGAIEANLLGRNLSDRVPLLERYGIWLKSIVLHWDWGQAPKGGEVVDEVGRRIGVSIRLITLGSLLGTVIGVLLGAWTATRQYKPSDRTTTAGSLFILSIPAFVLASALQVFATKINNATGLRLFEFVGETGDHGSYFGAALADRAQHLLLPTIALTLINLAFFSRIQRNLMLDALGSDFVRTARAKGLRRSRAVMKHALRTSLIPTGTYFAFSIATLFTGATFMEIMFSFHGMGEYGVSTITGQDVNGTVAVVAFSGACVLVGAVLSDIAVAILDPRVRLS